MSASRIWTVLCAGLAILLPALPSGASVSASGDSYARIAVADTRSTPEQVAAWDPDSLQRLVTLDGILYQEDTGFYYRVVENTVTVRLAEGVPSWNELVDRALQIDPRTFGALQTLTPGRTNRLGIVDLTLPDGTPPGWAELLFSTGLVRYAEVATYGVYSATPNDPLYSQQWALNNTGQTGGTPGADVSAEEAWDISAGDPSIVVAILDSGTSVDHPDLAPNVWHNDGEIPGNGTDDDSNGYVDDWEGWDFGNGNNDPRSNSFHGTHVTGVVNAAGSNNQGVVGLAGGLAAPGVRGMACAVGDSFPITSVLDDAILYAADNGAHVITLSLSVGQTSAIDDALDYAYNTKDVFIDCAAGNNGGSVNYPGTRPEIMAVASTDDDDRRSSFSNPGSQLEIAAPGSNILSTQLGNSYGTSSGTSFAAPYVGALAALIRSVNPGLSAPEVRQLIIDTADDVEAPGFDTLTGWGRINAFEALSAANVGDEGSIELDATLYGCNDLLRVAVEDFDLEGDGSIAVSVSSSLEPLGENVVLFEVGEGVFSGTLALGVGPTGQDGVLQVVHADTVVAEYIDADDGLGGINVSKDDTATIDCLGPQIAAVSTSGIDDDSATIGWTTDEPGTSLVRYGSPAPPDQEISGEALVTSHSLELSGLDECTTYKFEVESADEFDNVETDTNRGTYYTFQTLGNFPGIGVAPCRLGRASMDRNVYGCSGTVVVSITDFDLDTDSGVAETAQAMLTSTTESSGEWITLTEIAPDNGIFEGTIDLSSSGAVSDGLLSVAAGDLITVTYYDEDDGQGFPHVATYTSVADCTAPSIQNVQVSALSSTRAEITWTTDEPATSRVDFGPDAALGSSVDSPTLTTTHRLAVSAFDACDRVHFRVSGTDEFGDAGSADVAGQPFQFNLNRIGGLVFHDNFETDLGWDLPGEWERGAPAGQGTGSGDPDLAYSGSAVLGTDLFGNGSFPGDYEVGVTEWSFSPMIDTTGRTGLELILKRKLGVVVGDTAGIVFKKVVTQPVWNSFGSVDDTEWTEVRYPITNADNTPDIQIGLGITSSSGHSFGWNIDEMIVKESAEPDYLVCGGCAGAPSFGGLTAAYDPDPCGASGLTLEWQPASAWGTGDAGSYDVHRGTTAGFMPDESNRIATGISGTSWTDSGAPVDTTVWYVVRARNDEDCGGEGLADANLVRLSATETLSQPLPTGVGSSLQVLTIGDAHVRLTWDPVVGTDHYVVRRSTFPNFEFAVDLSQTTETLFEDVEAAVAAGNYYYRIFAVNACGIEAP